MAFPPADAVILSCHPTWRAAHCALPESDGMAVQATYDIAIGNVLGGEYQCRRTHLSLCGMHLAAAQSRSPGILRKTF